MKKELVTYILKLDESAKATKRAEDRSVYEKYLSSAAVVLALVESGADKRVIKKEVQTLERLLGNTWPVGDANIGLNSAWQKVKEAM